MSNVLHTFYQDYLDGILVSLDHHSASSEGNTISLTKTVLVIINRGSNLW